MFVVAALIAIVLGFSPKFGALIMTIPGPVLGGLVDRRVRPHHGDRRAYLGRRTASTSRARAISSSRRSR